MDIQPKCLHCGRKNTSGNYCCNCCDESWTRRYRTLDIETNPAYHKSEIISSFSHYSFNNKAGMLQYKLLPNRADSHTKTVGLTPLHYLSNFSFDGNFIFMKDEGQNPSGCFKDRESMMCKLNFENRKFDNAVIYSSGNAAASAALMLEGASNLLITFVPGDTYSEKIKYIREHGSDVVVIGDENTSFEEGYRLFADVNAAGIFADHHFDNWSVNNPYRVQGDKTIAVEIIKQLSPRSKVATVPDYVIVPTANGSCLTGIWKGFRELHEAGVIDTLPKMVSAGIKNANPVYKALKQDEMDKPVQCDLSKTDEEDADIGSIILAEAGYDSIQAASAVKESEGLAVELHAADIQHTLVNFLKKENEQALKYAILPEPASVTSLAAIKKLPTTASSSNPNIIVCVSTGHGLKALDKIESLLENKPALQKTAKRIAAKRNKMMQPAPDKTGDQISADADLASVLETFLGLQKSYQSEPFVQPV